MIKKTFFAGLLLLPLFFSCKPKEIEQEKKSYTVHGDTVIVTNEILAKKLKVSEVKISLYEKEVTTTGTVQAIPTQFAYIAPPFPGRIIKSYVKLGQHVNAGTPLFEINSPDFTEAQKEFYKAQSEKDLAQKDLIRKQDLLKNGVGSQKELEEAQNILKIADKEYENAMSVLNVYQANPKEMRLGQPMIVRTPITGNVIENNIVTGQYINDNAEPVATIADLNQVWIVAQVKEKDIRFIHIGDEMDISVAALPDTNITGTVFHVDQSVDEETRSIKVLSICDNKDGLLKLGMFASVRFLDKPTEALSIPEKAILQDEKTSFVYIQIGINKFLKKAITVETIKDGNAIITKGLTLGEKLIVEGGYYLK